MEVNLSNFFRNRSFRDYVLICVAIYIPIILAVSVYTAFNSTIKPPVAKGLVANWSFRSNLGHNARDTVGSNAGYIYNPNWGRGRGYLALQLDGKNTYVKVSDHNSQELINGGEFTVGAWLKPEDSDRSILFQQTSTGDQYPPLTVYAPWSRRLAIVFSNQERRVGFLSDDSLDIGKWQHIAVSVDLESGDINYYINGKPTGTDKTTIEYTPSDGPVLIGTGLFEKEKLFFYKGQLDSVSLYDRVLGEGEVKELAGW